MLNWKMIFGFIMMIYCFTLNDTLKITPTGGDNNDRDNCVIDDEGNTTDTITDGNSSTDNINGSETSQVTDTPSGATGNTLNLNRGGGNSSNGDSVTKGATTLPPTVPSSGSTKPTSVPPTKPTSVPAVPATTEAPFKCPPGTENGVKLANPKYKTEGCESYYECGTDGKGKLTKCPEGQAFMSVGKSLKCVDKSQIDECPNFFQGCQDKINASPDSLEFQNLTYPADLVNRSRYYFCDQGSPFHMSCPLNPDPTLINIYYIAGICFPFNKTAPSTPCPTGVGFSGTFPETNYQKNGCKFYYICLYGVGHLTSCPNPQQLYIGIGEKRGCYKASSLDNCATGLFDGCTDTKKIESIRKPDPTDPTRYYSCDGGTPFRNKCTEGSKFDLEAGDCLS